MYYICQESVLVIICCTENILDIIDIVKRFTFQAILNGTVAVDTFFLLRWGLKLSI